MQIQWYGQSAFALSGDGKTVFIDPFGDMQGLAERGLRFDDCLAKFGDVVHRADGPTVDLAAVAERDGGAVAVVPAAP